MSNIGIRIREARVKLGLSQAECARKLGLRSQGNLSRWEKGEVTPLPHTVARIEKALGVTLRPPKEPISGSNEAQHHAREIIRHGKRLEEILATSDES